MAAAVAKMSFGNRIGFAFNHDVDRTVLFAPQAGSLVLELREGDMCLEGLTYTLIGSTIDSPEIVLEGEEMALDDLMETWMPVSYTHLDVYKRQELDNLGLMPNLNRLGGPLAKQSRNTVLRLYADEPMLMRGTAYELSLIHISGAGHRTSGTPRRSGRPAAD